MTDKTTYYYFTPDGERKGPFTREELRELRDRKEIPESASVLTGENGNWHLLVDVLSRGYRERRPLGKCPRCHEEILSVQEASYGRCRRCRFMIGVPRNVAGIRRNLMFTLMSHYFCFRGRAMKPEYWSFVGACAFGCFVMALALFVCFELSMDEFNLNLINGRQFYELVRDAGGYTTVQYGFFIAIGALVLLAFIPACGVCVRRLHDISFSGWWFTLMLALCAAPFAVVGMLWTHPGSHTLVQVKDIVLHPGYIVATALYVLLIVVLLPLKDSTPGPNKYGPSPKYPNM